MPKRVQVIEIEDRNPFGEETDPSQYHTDERDALYIEGYSDKRKAFELAVARGERPDPLEWRMHWVRSQAASGDADGRKVAEWRAKGYIPVRWEDADKYGIDLESSAAVKGPDGTVRLGDVVLMAAPAKVAATHYQRQREQTADMVEQRVYGPMQDAVDSYNRRTGDRTEAIREVEVMDKKSYKGGKKDA